MQMFQKRGKNCHIRFKWDQTKTLFILYLIAGACITVLHFTSTISASHNFVMQSINQGERSNTGITLWMGREGKVLICRARVGAKKGALENKDKKAVWGVSPCKLSLPPRHFFNEWPRQKTSLTSIQTFEWNGCSAPPFSSPSDLCVCKILSGKC